MSKQDFTIVEDFEGYPAAVLKGHVEPADLGYNSRLLYCRCDEGKNITEAVTEAIDGGLWIVRTRGDFGE